MATEVAAVAVAGAPATRAGRDKGLKKNAIGYVSNIVIGVASTAPAYSLAATLGFIVADPGVGVHAPGVLLAAFVPMLLVSLAYRYLNSADPDAGTTFAWTTRAFGPGVRLGQRLGDLPRRRARDGLARLHRGDLHLQAVRLALRPKRTRGAALVGCVLWIGLMTWICYRGIELSARIQQVLLSAEFADPGDLRGRRARQGLRQPRRATRSSRGSPGSTRSR